MSATWFVNAVNVGELDEHGAGSGVARVSDNGEPEGGQLVNDVSDRYAENAL